MVYGMDDALFKKLEKIAMDASATLTRRGGLDSRFSDDDDFPKISIWSLREMLVDAYKLGAHDATHRR